MTDGTNYCESPLVTLESITKIVAQFQDRRPAVATAIRINPLWKDVFLASLREEGVVCVQSPDALRLSGMPIVLDRSVPYGKIEYDYAGGPILGEALYRMTDDEQEQLF